MEEKDADALLRIISRIREAMPRFEYMSQQEKEIDAYLIRIALVIRKEMWKAA